MDQPELPWDEPDPEPRKRKGLPPPPHAMPITRRDGTTVDAAHEWVLDHAETTRGAICPGCDRFTRHWKRKINATMGRALIVMYRVAGTEFTHTPSLPVDGHEISQAKHWNIVEEAEGRREDQGRRGYWRLTDKGVDYVHNRIRIPKFARTTYGPILLNLEGPMVNIVDALEEQFRYDDLMWGE